jgi:hypothetical protein
MDGTFTQMVEEMKNATIHHEITLTTTLLKHKKKKMELVMGCLKKVKEKFFDLQTKKETWHASA